MYNCRTRARSTKVGTNLVNKRKVHNKCWRESFVIKNARHERQRRALEEKVKALENELERARNRLQSLRAQAEERVSTARGLTSPINQSFSYVHLAWPELRSFWYKLSSTIFKIFSTDFSILFINKVRRYAGFVLFVFCLCSLVLRVSIRPQFALRIRAREGNLKRTVHSCLLSNQYD